MDKDEDFSVNEKKLDIVVERDPTWPEFRVQKSIKTVCISEVAQTTPVRGPDVYSLARNDKLLSFQYT